MTGTASSYPTNSTITWTSGVVLDTKSGDRPASTPKELLSTRAIESKDGWLGQIVMSGEIVYQTEPQTDAAEDDPQAPFRGSEKALALVNRRIHDAFRQLILGADSQKA